MASEPQKNRNIKIECLRYAPLLNEFVDGRLSADITWKISSHIALCESCAETVRSLNAISRVLNSAPKYEVSSNFAAALEARIAATSRSAVKLSWSRRFFNGVMFGLTEQNGGFQRLSAPFAAATVIAVFAALVFVHPIYPTVHTTNVPPISSAQSDMPDSTVVQACVNQHRDQTTSDPLGDTSAQLLATSVDNLPVDSSKTQNLSDDDAAVLLDEEM